MVRKVTSITACVLLLLCAAAATASAVNVYEGTISSTFSAIAEDIDISVVDDYVFFRSGQYEYILLVGDINYSNGNFNLVGNGRTYKITQLNGSNYSGNYYSYAVSDVSSYNVSAGDKLVYSNLGNYPTLFQSGDKYDFISCFILVILGLCMLIRPLFDFVLRSRKGS